MSTTETPESGATDPAPSPGGRVLVLAGGLSHERDVSLRSGRRVAEALRGSGLEVVERDVDASLLELLRTERPACVVPMLHGETGEDGAIREVLELLDRARAELGLTAHARERFRMDVLRRFYEDYGARLGGLAWRLLRPRTPAAPARGRVLDGSYRVVSRPLLTR